jgi:hypothetical protein
VIAVKIVPAAHFVLEDDFAFKLFHECASLLEKLFLDAAKMDE